jgi:excisionase family DNA binding protein
MTTQPTHQPPGAWNAHNLLTVLEVAERAGTHPKSVYRWIKEGKLEAIQFGPRTFLCRKMQSASFCIKLVIAEPLHCPSLTGESSHDRLCDPA